MRSVLPRLRDLNPLRLFQSNFSYAQLPLDSRNGSRNGSPFTLQPLKNFRWPSNGGARERLRCCRPSITRTFLFAMTTLLLFALAAGGGYKHHVIKTKTESKVDSKPEPFYWQKYSR